jgi:uncharacterized protein
MSPFEPQVDPATCARTFLARVTRELEEVERRWAELRDRAATAAEELGRLGATGVWLFGSLAWGEPHAQSDIDLLVEGIAEGRWVEAARAVERQAAGVRVDLVRAEDAPASLTARVREEGRRLR